MPPRMFHRYDSQILRAYFARFGYCCFDFLAMARDFTYIYRLVKS